MKYYVKDCHNKHILCKVISIGNDIASIVLQQALLCYGGSVYPTGERLNVHTDYLYRPQVMTFIMDKEVIQV